MCNVESVAVSEHCAQKFMQRSRWAKPNAKKAKAKVLKMLSQANKVLLKPGYRVNCLLRHKFKDQEFYQFNDWIFVVDPHEQQVVTCYPASGMRWARV